MKEFVECPLCGKSYKSITKNHLRKKHGVSLEQLLEQFPGIELESEELRARRSAINKEIANRDNARALRSERAKRQHETGSLNPSRVMRELWDTDRDGMIQKMREAQKRPEVIQRKAELMAERWKEPGYKQRVFSREDVRVPKISQASKRMWENKRDYIIEKMLEAQKRPEVIQRKSEIMTERRKDESFNEVHRQAMIRLFNDEEWVKNLSKSQKGLTFRSKWYGEFHVRSSYEMLVCEMLELLEIPYDYEVKRFPYFFEGAEHIYVVDFYLKDFDLYLEVKPKVFEGYAKVQAKFNSVKDKGLNIIFIDEDYVFDIEAFQTKLYASTTIRKPGNPIQK